MKILRPDIHKKIVDGTYTVKNWYRFNLEIAIQMIAEEKALSPEEYENKYMNNSCRYGEQVRLKKIWWKKK